MLKVGDKVSISPNHTICFANKMGRVVGINPDDGLSIKVKILRDGESRGVIFGFSPEELVKIEESVCNG